jgi:uncharacterized membrane protein
MTKFALLVGATLWCATIIAAPVLGLHFVYDAFSTICHQDPSRSFHLDGSPLPVCIRCASIYFGFLFALILSLRSTPRAVKVAVALTIVEFIVAKTAWDSPWLRSATGLVLGGAIAPFVQQGVAEMFHRGELRESM